MCTVTFIPGKQGILLTSNRDESLLRAAAVHPQAYQKVTGKVMFPMDADARGTWIAVHENGNAIVLLNGGLVNHIPAPPYRKSRGLIVLELIDTARPFQTFTNLDLEGIEPFTLVIWDNNVLYEVRWDGKTKHKKIPDPAAPHIWSSVTLYTPEVIRKRESWFADWLKNNPEPDQDAVLRFHQFTGDGDTNNDLLMNRNGVTFTVSITSLRLGRSYSELQYLDLKNNSRSTAQLVTGQPNSLPSKTQMA